MGQWFTDFSHNTPDQVPSDWTERFAGGTGIVRDSGIPSGASVTNTHALEAASDLRMSFDTPGEPSGDVDLLVLLLQTNMPNGDKDVARVWLHGDETGGTNYYYASICDSDSSFVESNSLYKFVNNEQTLLSRSNSPTHNSNTWYWLRLQRTGTTIRMRSWEDGSSEPGTWTLSNSDTDHDSGHVGLHRTSGGTLWVAQVGVGTLGDDAPTEPLLTTADIHTDLVLDAGADTQATATTTIDTDLALDVGANTRATVTAESDAALVLDADATGGVVVVSAELETDLVLDAEATATKAATTVGIETDLVVDSAVTSGVVEPRTEIDTDIVLDATGVADSPALGFAWVSPPADSEVQDTVELVTQTTDPRVVAVRYRVGDVVIETTGVGGESS